jgi:signal transduction histidine kinase
VLISGLVALALHELRREQDLARTRQEFVSGVSHELRTPLAQIRLFAELLRMGKLRSDEERQRSLEIIDEEAQRLTYLVENVLSFSSSEHASTSIVLRPVDVRDEVVRACDAFTPLARARRNRIRVDAPPGVTAMGDAKAVRQILLNLLDNAVKYGPVGQEVTVSVTRRGERVIISVSDHGPGIPAEERERVWEPYFRLAREAESAAGGSGIGLSIVKELVRAQGGELRVDDADPSNSQMPGLRISFDLRAAMEPAEPLPQNAEPIETGIAV